MTSRLNRTFNCFRLIVRAVVMVAAITSPLLAIPSLHAADETIIVAPTAKNSGAGFILMVGLRRA